MRADRHAGEPSRLCGTGAQSCSVACAADKLRTHRERACAHRTAEQHDESTPFLGTIVAGHAYRVADARGSNRRKVLFQHLHGEMREPRLGQRASKCAFGARPNIRLSYNFLLLVSDQQGGRL
jgi:hypothetical protein